MPRWPDGYVAGKWRICPTCGGKKDHDAVACRKCSTPKKPLLGLKGPDHPAWKNGSRIDKDGYVKTYAPDHPWPRRGGYVFEHVRVVELDLGRRLLSNESVHHVDHDRRNNSLGNLEVMSRSEHSRYHRTLDTHARTRDPKGRFASERSSLNASE